MHGTVETDEPTARSKWKGASLHVDSLQVLRSWMEMEKSKAISADLKTPTNSGRKRSSDGKVAKTRKAPRYWSSQDRGDYPKNNKVKEKEGNVEEIIIDPMVLKKYTRGKMVDIKVFRFVNRKFKND